MIGNPDPCSLPECTLCREIRYMKLHLTHASAIHATAVCMKACRDVQQFRDRRSAAFRDWVTRQTDQAAPGDKIQEFAADGSFPRFGPCIAVQITSFMNSDFGPCPGQRGCVFPENKSDHGGCDNSYTWAELLNIPAAGYFWWMGWWYAYPDIPVQWPQCISVDLVSQIGGRTHLENVSHPDFEPAGPRYFGSDVVAGTHGARPVAPPPLQ